MSETINYLFTLLQTHQSLFLKVNRDSQLLQLVSSEGKVFPTQQIIGQKLTNFLPPSVIPHFTEAVFKTINLHSINSLTLNQALHPTMPFSLKLQFVPADTQSVGLVVSTFKEDYTSTQFYERVPVMIVYLDKEENVIWANQHFCKKSNFEKADVVGLNARDFLRINPRLVQTDALRAKDPHVRTEYNLVGKNRTKLTVIASAVAQHDDEGHFLCTTVVLRDITKMKDTQTELEYQKRALDEAAIVAVTDVKGNITYVNDKFCDISQYSREELIGQNHRMLKSGVHPPELFEDMWATIYAGDIWRGEVCNNKKDGSKYWVYTTIIPFLNEKGRPFRYQAIRFEITERKIMEQQIQQYTEHLEDIVAERTEEITQQTENLYAVNRELSIKNDTLDRRNHEIQQSIHYAKRIQEAILPRQISLPSFIKDFFVLYQPKDIVSGDFYWWHTNVENECLTIAAVDCTGHGVPGAFMSMIGSTLLDEIVKTKKIISPAEILNQMRIEIGEILHQEITQNRDGMDMAVVTINNKLKKMYVAGARNGVLLVQDEEMTFIKGDKMNIGGKLLHGKTFTQHEILLDRPTKFYLFSDGYSDQFGGTTQNEKFMSKRLKELIFNNSSLSMQTQKEQLTQVHQDWRKDQKQLDDILVMGFEV